MGRVLTLIIMALLLSSCAGFRRGLESRISENTITTDQKMSFLEVKERNLEYVEILNLPGISLEFNLWNRITTHDSGWLLFIPVYWTNGNLDYFKNKKEGYELRMTVMFNEKGYTFDYNKVKLYVDEDLFYPINLSGYGTIQKEIDQGKSEIDLDKHNGKMHFSIAFDIQTPFPDRDIKLDLSDALINNRFPQIPVVQFKKHTWSLFYS